MFVRVKKHNGKEYAYLVENSWTKNGTRQRTKKYLGRLFYFSKNNIPNNIYNSVEKDSSELKYYDIEELRQLDFDSIIKKILEIELLSLGFKKTEEFLFEKEHDKKSLIVNLKDLSFIANKKSFVIKNNEGFMCKETIENLLNTKINKKETETENRNYLIKNLLKNLLEAGLKPENEMLLLLHDKYLEKINKEKQ
ncbi:MAG: hypothetical protein QXU20_03425 [Candidatus Woesearchaeota archaeon]